MTTHLGTGDDNPDERVIVSPHPLHALVQLVGKEDLPVAHTLDCGGVVRWEGLSTELPVCVSHTCTYSSLKFKASVIHVL